MTETLTYCEECGLGLWITSAHFGNVKRCGSGGCDLFWFPVAYRFMDSDEWSREVPIEELEEFDRTYTPIVRTETVWAFGNGNMIEFVNSEQLANEQRAAKAMAKASEGGSE